MKKPSTDGSAGRVKGELSASPFGQLYPTLLEWMETDRWEDGTQRATTTLFIFVDVGLIKAMLKDRDASKVAFVSGTSLEAVLEAIERGLSEGSTEWKVDRPPAGRGRK